jgi:hypothetical protein
MAPSQRAVSGNRVAGAELSTRTDHCIDAGRQAPPRHVPERTSACSDETGSAAGLLYEYVSHEVTGFSAPTGLDRAGAIIPPTDLYQVGHLHFVRDGHHRVSIARAHGQRAIDADVTAVTTRCPPAPRWSRHSQAHRAAD